MDAPPSIVTPPLPPFELILWAADALPAGPTKAQLLYMATWKSVPDRPVAGASDAIRKLRALLPRLAGRSEEHPSELQSLVRISYAVFCLKNIINEYLTTSTNRTWKRL